MTSGWLDWLPHPADPSGECSIIVEERSTASRLKTVSSEGFGHERDLSMATIVWAYCDRGRWESL